MCINMSSVKAVRADADSNKPVTPGQDNSFDGALGRAVELMREGGEGGRVRCSNALAEVCYTLFRIRVAQACWSWPGCSQALVDEVVQECVVNFWQSLERGGAMADRLAALEGKDLRAYLAGVIRESSRQRLGQVLGREYRHRGYGHAPKDLAKAQEGKPDDPRPWWDAVLDARRARESKRGSRTISALDLAEALHGKSLGTAFEEGILDAAAEILNSTGHKELTERLIEAAKAVATAKAKEKAEKKKPSRTAQRRRMESKERLGSEMEM